MSNAVGEAFIRVRPNTSTFAAETRLGVATGLKGAGAGGLSAAAGLTPARVGALAVGLAFKYAIGAAADFEQTMNVFQATSRATGAEMQKVSATARELGADMSLPSTSATDAGTAMLQLSKGGLSVIDTMNAAKGVLQLAAAAEIDVAQAGDIVARSLSAFELPGTDAMKVTDLLAGASIAATGDMNDMALALQQAGSVAAQMGIPLETVVAQITILAKKGIVGSDAGTSLKQAYLKLIPVSKEAGDVVEALGIKVADSAGNFLSQEQIWDNYRVALEKLEPATRQQALTQIFGSDAIRVANELWKSGAKGITENTKEVTRAGTGAELSAAKAKGLKGQWDGLKSAAETLGTTVGGVMVPALTGVVTISAAVVTATNDMAAGFIDFNREVGGKALFEFVEHIGKPVAHGFHKFGEEVFDLQHGIQDFLGTGDKFTQQMVDLFNIDLTGSNLPDAASEIATQAKTSVADAMAATGTDVVAAVKEVDPALVRAAKASGEKYAKHVAAGILQNAQQAVVAAKDMLAQTIRAGDEAIEDSAVSAKQNLTSIGRSLSESAASMIDAGPLGRKIKALQDALRGSQSKREKSTLTRDLRDANDELIRAKKQVASAAGRTPEQQAAVDAFLRPFKEKVEDAKAALGEFNTEGVIDKLEAAATAQKTAVVEGIEAVVAAFNAGRISAAQANSRIAKVLGSAIPEYRTAGAGLGTALRNGFFEALKGLQAQIAEIVNGPQTSKTGAEVNVVSPAEVAAKSAGEVAAARVAVSVAKTALQDTLMSQANDKLQNALTLAQEQIDAQDESNSLLASINKQLGAKPPVASPKTTSTSFAVVTAVPGESATGPRRKK